MTRVYNPYLDPTLFKLDKMRKCKTANIFCVHVFAHCIFSLKRLPIFEFPNSPLRVTPHSIALMMVEEKLCLKWNDFQGNLISSFGELRGDRDFTDVTLACEDNARLEMEAHKVILSSCSEFFSKILKQNPNLHPLIYLQDVSIRDLELLKSFMYMGRPMWIWLKLTVSSKFQSVSWTNPWITPRKNLRRHTITDTENRQTGRE